MHGPRACTGGKHREDARAAAHVQNCRSLEETLIVLQRPPATGTGGCAMQRSLPFTAGRRQRPALVMPTRS